MADLSLLLLPDDASAPPTMLALDADGRIMARGPDAGAAAVRRVLAVPGQHCRMLRLRLPARSLQQARAAARLMLQQHLADDPGQLHVAVGPADADAHRWAVAVSPERMHGWLERARALGFDPGAVVPAPLLLDWSGGKAVRSVDHDGLRLACGADLCFAAESELAEQLLAGRDVERLPDAESALARGATAPAIDLLQDAFAPAAERREGWPAWRRVAVLAGIVLLSPLALPAATALRDHLGARRAEAQVAELARSVLPALPASADAAAAVRARLDTMRRADRFAHATGALFAAVSGIADAELDSLAWSDGTLRATLAVPGPADLERLRTELAGKGLELVEDGRQDGADAGRHHISLRPSP